MDELPQVHSRVIRKSSYGRTDLFLKDSSVLVREIRCMGGIKKRETANVYHMLGDARNAVGTCCWHCCEAITDEASVVPLPCVYDTSENMYHVYGRTCSPGCAKAYILEHATFDRGQHLNVLVRMLRDVYGITGPVVETPPRPALVKFGGVFDVSNVPKAHCRLVTPPFVSYCMLVEEHGDDAAHVVSSAPQDITMEDDDIGEPLPPAAFGEYVAQRSNDDSGTVSSRRKRTTAPASSSSSGPMSKFCRR